MLGTEHFQTLGWRHRELDLEKIAASVCSLLIVNVCGGSVQGIAGDAIQIARDHVLIDAFGRTR